MLFYCMQVMDGLTRRELEFVPLRVKRSISRALEDKDESIRAYVVGGRNVLKSWVSQSSSFIWLHSYFYTIKRQDDFNKTLIELLLLLWIGWRRSHISLYGCSAFLFCFLHLVRELFIELGERVQRPLKRCSLLWYDVSWVGLSWVESNLCDENCQLHHMTMFAQRLASIHHPCNIRSKMYFSQE